MWDDLWAALALVLVIEGLWPALSPRRYRRTVLSMAQLDDRTLRATGLVAMILGAVFVYLLRN